MCGGNTWDKVKDAAVTWSTGGLNKAGEKAGEKVKEAAQPDMPEPPEPPQQPKQPKEAKGPQEEAKEAIENQKRRRLASTGQSSTILTGARGTDSGPTLGRSTLLGS